MYHWLGISLGTLDCLVWKLGQSFTASLAWHYKFEPWYWLLFWFLECGLNLFFLCVCEKCLLPAKPFPCSFTPKQHWSGSFSRNEDIGNPSWSDSSLPRKQSLVFLKKTTPCFVLHFCHQTKDYMYHIANDTNLYFHMHFANNWLTMSAYMNFHQR